jgi:Metallo-beta-lactamase superfamily
MTNVSSARLRAYNVGFGDCLLLSLTYDDDSKRHVLIDFGSTELPTSARPGHMERIAQNIAEETDNKLDVLVATHRHADHISGFGHSAAGKIIAGLKPEVVIQPWTEDPALKTDARQPAAAPNGHRALHSSLADMQAFAAGARAEGLRLANVTTFPKRVAERLAFMGETNLKNKDAVEALMKMGKKTRAVYAKFGDDLGIDDLLPGVTVEVLGPPTLEQAPDVAGEAEKHKEFWSLAASWGRAVEAGTATADDLGDHIAPLFPTAVSDSIPLAAQWLIPRLNRSYADEMLSLLRIMDGVLNNTSLILLFHIGNTSLLFPGDAQIENWSYALFDVDDADDIRARLAETNLYKVGHHGSLNSTPRTLWKGFVHKETAAHADEDRLISVMSTKAGKHGHIENDTEVPRRTLVDALKAFTEHNSTQSRTGKNPWADVDVPIR